MRVFLPDSAALLQSTRRARIGRALEPYTVSENAPPAFLASLRAGGLIGTRSRARSNG
jgi:hypothetical protein